MTYSVLIVDDDAATRSRIREVVADVVPHGVVAGVRTAREACDLVRSVSWQLAVVEMQLPDRSGLAVVHAILASRSKTHIVVTAALRDSYESIALRAGAHAFIAKDQLTARLPALLRERTNGR